MPVSPDNALASSTYTMSKKSLSDNGTRESTCMPITKGVMSTAHHMRQSECTISRTFFVCDIRCLVYQIWCGDIDIRRHEAQTHVRQRRRWNRNATTPCAARENFAIHSRRRVKVEIFCATATFSGPLRKTATLKCNAGAFAGQKKDCPGCNCAPSI
jgi:hypothetical protein